jgi:iron(III) transport system substrate-binding protein
MTVILISCILGDRLESVHPFIDSAICTAHSSPGNRIMSVSNILHTGWLFPALVFLLATVLPATTAAAAEQVNVYSARHYDSDDALYDAFTTATGIEVHVLQGDSDQLIARIQREGGASPADVLMTVDAARLWRAEQAGVLEPVRSKVLEERVPAHLRHPQGLWFGFSTRARLIFRRGDAVAEDAVATYESLAGPDLRGRVCIRSSTNVYNQSLIASMIAADGAEATQAWARGLVGNLARRPQGGDTDQLRALAAGECDVAVANHYYYARLQESDDAGDRAVADAISVVLPNQEGRGAHVNIGGAGVVRDAPHRANAVRFLEFLASPEAQALFAAGNYEFPAVPDAEPHPAIAFLEGMRTDQVNVSVLGRHNAEAVKIADRAGWR